jgi:hypothetical protein
MAEDGKNVVEQAAPTRALKSLLVACLRKGLAGEAGAQNVVWRDGIWKDFADIAQGRESEVPRIKGAKSFVDLAGENALVTELAEGDMKPAQACEQIDKSHRVTGSSLALIAPRRNVVGDFSRGYGSITLDVRLPKADDSPPGLEQRRSDGAVAAAICLDFSQPVVGVMTLPQLTLQDLPVPAVPKVPVTEYKNLASGKHDVGFSGQIPDVLAESQAQSPQFTPE